GGSYGGNRRQAATRSRHHGILANPSANRRRYRSALHAPRPHQGATRESDRDRSVSRHRKGGTRTRARRICDDADGDGGHRQANLSQAWHYHLWIQSVQDSARGDSAGNARKRRATVGRQRRLRRTVLLRHTALHTVVSPAGASALVAECYAASGQVVGRHFQSHAIPGQHTNSESPHLPRNGSVHIVPVVHLHAESRIRQHFGNGSFQLDCFFFGHKPP